MPVPPTQSDMFQQLPVVALMPRDEPSYNPANLPGEDLHSAGYTSNPVVDRTLILGKYFWIKLSLLLFITLRNFFRFPFLIAFLLFLVDYESIPRVTARLFGHDQNYQSPAAHVVPTRFTLPPMPLAHLTTSHMSHVFTRPLPTATFYRPRQVIIRPPRPSALPSQVVPNVASEPNSSPMETSRPSTPAPTSIASDAPSL